MGSQRKSLIFLFALISIAVTCGWKTKDSLNFDASYVIYADLNPELRNMTYTEITKVANTGNGSTKVLYYHIYGNKFKGLRQVEDGDIEVLSAVDQNGTPLQWQREQEGVLYCVKLAEELEPGQIAEITFKCEVLIPDLESMYGISGDGDVQLPMFSLQLAMYDRNGWDIAPLQENGDGRYSAASNYELTISVPEEYVMACNGDEISRKTRDGVTTFLYKAEERRDIVVFACKDYVTFKREVGATEILGFFNEEVDGATRERMECVMDGAAFALEYFNGIFGVYPYDTLVVVNSARGTNISPNMEYSGLITILLGSEQLISIREKTFHEVAHQWFYGLVGNNENLEPWLDEGFAEFAAGLCLEADSIEKNTDSYWELKELASNAVSDEKINIPSDEASVYQWVIYDRSAVFLKTLMDAIGREKFISILSEYCRKYKYDIATTERFVNMLQVDTDADISNIVTEFIM